MTNQRTLWAATGLTIVLAVSAFALTAHPVSKVLWAGATLGSCALAVITGWSARTNLTAHSPHSQASRPPRTLFGALAAPLAGLTAACIFLSFIVTGNAVAILRLVGAVLALLALIAALAGPSVRSSTQA